MSGINCRLVQLQNEIIGFGVVEVSPYISVLMGVYYKSQNLSLLMRSVESILNQSVSDFELLICDDGSSEEAKKLLETYAERDSRVKLLRPGNVYRLPCKLNICLKEASGQFIARMDDDDYSHPERFEKQIEALIYQSDLAFVGCNVNLCRNKEIFAQRILPEYPVVSDFYMTQPYIHPALMFRKAAIALVNGYCEDMYCDLCEDYDLLLRLYAHGFHGMNIQDVLLDYSVSTGKKTRKIRHRINESEVRWKRFCELKIMPEAFPFVIKPIATGLIPEPLLKEIKRRRGTG